MHMKTNQICIITFFIWCFSCANMTEHRCIQFYLYVYLENCCRSNIFSFIRISFSFVWNSARFIKRKSHFFSECRWVEIRRYYRALPRSSSGFFEFSLWRGSTFISEIVWIVRNPRFYVQDTFSPCDSITFLKALCNKVKKRNAFWNYIFQTFL